MGLDMFLTKEVSVNAEYEYSKVTGTVDIQANGKQIVSSIKNLSTMVYIVGYWRKANHIHKWFVQNVQDSVDECQQSYVSNEDIKTLYDLCVLVNKELDKLDLVIKQVTDPYTKEIREIATYANTEAIEVLLPTQCGFFFGDCKIDKWYKQDLLDTIDILEPLLDSKDRIYYQSSW